MAKAGTADYRIKKLEKGPLQRFKNQNLLIKKFGEIGLQVYKAITGKRTTQELKKDLGIDPELFDQVLSYMQDAGMVELEPMAKEEAPEEKAPPEEEIKPEGELLPPEEAPTLEELPPEEELIKEEEIPPLEEERREEEEEIKPIGAEEEEVEEKPEEEAPPEEEEEEPEEEITLEAEEAPEEKPEEEEEIAPPEEEGEITAYAEEEEYEEPSELSPVEKIISDKYGDIGLQVYSLIDGARTAEEIMRDTGLSEPKLVEILDFMDEQGIIKLDYPKGGPPPTERAPPLTEAPPTPKREEAFVPMIEEEAKLGEAGGVPSPVGVPIKAPLDIVKSVQMKAKTMLKFGDKGGKILELMDGKNDIIDIALKLDLPLYGVSGIIDYMLENGMAIMKPLSRADVRHKYGDDGYSVYKKYGKEGLMLYELIGKELTIKQMADKITKERAQIVDMFIFIHRVLGIELPIDKNVLAKELGL